MFSIINIANQQSYGKVGTYLKACIAIESSRAANTNSLHFSTSHCSSLILSVDFESSNGISNSRNNRSITSWKSELNENLIKFINNKCGCKVRIAMHILESEDNPKKLFYYCPFNKCGYFRWWYPSPTALNNVGLLESLRVHRGSMDSQQ